MDIITDLYSGEEVCTGCGLVVGEVVLNRGRDSPTYSSDVKARGRRYGSGARPSLFDRGLNTVINGNTDAFGALLSREAVQNMKRIQRQDNRSKISESVTRNLSIAMAELDRLTSNLHLPSNIKEDAAILYRQALDKDLIRGRSIDAFVAASLYAACRLRAVPRPLSLVCNESKRTKKEVSMTYRILLKELGLKPPVDNPLKYVSVLAHKLKIPRPTERRAVEILEEARRSKELTGKDPRGLAAAALYLASELNGERVIQSNVSKMAETTEVTLRNRYRGLKKALGYV